MAEQLSLFDQLVNMIDEQQRAPQQAQGNRFTPIESNATWPTGMRRPPVRANVATGQLTLPLPERAIPGEIIQPRNLEAAGINTLPWERTVAGAAPAAASSPAAAAGVSQATPQLAGQLSFLDDAGKVATGALPLPPPPAAQANMGTLEKSFLGRMAQGEATNPLLKKLFGPQAVGRIGNAVIGTGVAMLPEIIGIDQEQPGGRVASEILRGAGGGTATLGPGFGTMAGLQQGLAQGSFELGRAMQNNPDASIGDKAKNALAQGVIQNATMGMPGGSLVSQGANFAGRWAPEDWGNSLSEITGKVTSKIPVVGGFLSGMTGGGEEQPQQDMSQYDALVASGFGSDAADVERRQQVYTALQNTGIDSDIAFSVAWGDAPIGQKVANANNVAGPWGNLQAQSQALATNVQPYVDQMRASAASLGDRMSGTTSLNEYAPALVDLTNANAAALQGFAAQYPYLMEMQRRGDLYQNYADSVARSKLAGDTTSDNSFLSYLDINPSDLQQQ